MDCPPKVDIFGVNVSRTDYEEACRVIIEAGRAHRSFGVTALAVHGLLEAARDPGFRAVVNSLDLVTPDGQPVRWAENLFHDTGLKDRVAGPDLLWKICAAAERAKISVYFYGSTEDTCERMVARIKDRHPELCVAGVQPDRFREATPEEDRMDVRRIHESGAGFDFAAGVIPRAPSWMQKNGLEWFHRLTMEPRRLGRRYMVTNSIFIFFLARECARRWRTGAAFRA